MFHIVVSYIAGMSTLAFQTRPNYLRCKLVSLNTLQNWNFATARRGRTRKIFMMTGMNSGKYPDRKSKTPTTMKCIISFNSRF
jgi:hypothetical protein